QADASRAIVRALNLPFYSFLRVTFIHGPCATGLLVIGLYILNAVAGTEYATWQILVFAATVLFFASPTHAILEFFAISREVAPTVERLWQFCERIHDEHRTDLISIKLKGKLFYLSIFVTALPLLFFAASIIFKVQLLFSDLGVDVNFQQMLPLWMWVIGVVAVCMVGALVMSVLTASEVSRSAAKLIGAMNEVEKGVLDNRLFITGTDEYADLFRGYNLMTASLREEVKILEVTHDLTGELNLDVLLERIMRAAVELLNAERGTLFIHDHKTKELWSRFAEGLIHRELRIPDDKGIAGLVYQSGEALNVDKPYEHPLFNAEIDKRTGYVTTSILCLPIINKAGDRIGVTQILNKKGGVPFTQKDEVRLRAFTAQIAVSLENAQLFEDVLNMKNYNESILRSTSNGMVTLSKERDVVTANDAATAILHLPADRIIGKPAREVFGAANGWVIDAVARVEETGTSNISVDAGIKLADGAEVSVNMTAVPLLDSNKEDIGSMLILEDISAEKRVKSTMARYMSKEIVDQLLEAGEDQLGGKDQKISVLFSDVRSFTTISEALGARETVSMLNEYFAVMVDVIFSNGGILDKYIGDAIMALFGAPFNGPHDADNAVTVANQMMAALHNLNMDRIVKGKTPIDIGVGVSTGDVVVGNIGSPKRMEYTVIGDSVNLASRLEGATKYYGTKILLSENTVKDLTKPFLMREIDLIRVKGKDRPVAVYEALDFYRQNPATFPNIDAVLVAYAKGLAAYRARDWQTAITAFTAAVNANPDERPSRIYLDRCTHYMAHPPAANWDGVWTLSEK
ncbi:MAG: GAF domain-containing protein, partial [Rhodospirillaceae bacterium]|nr:GAF domain-containing protein [Rhodospirillaceae bacterium]